MTDVFQSDHDRANSDCDIASITKDIAQWPNMFYLRSIVSQKPFAHRGTQTKLTTVGDYLAFYTRALSGKFHLTYFDGFAGSGEIPHGEELPLFEGMADFDKAIQGSARVALKSSPPFDRYIFVDSKKKHVARLASLKSEFPTLVDRITVRHDDANYAVREFCGTELNGKRRAVIFLDPFGNSVKWSTIEAIAAVPKIDLWYLFPSGIGVVRQISKDSRVQRDAERSLDEMFGTTEWRASFSAPVTQRDLLDPDRETMTKIATADDVTRYMIARMKTVFKGVVLDRWLPLGKKGGHWYSLIFACSNPSPAAKELATRVANDIMRRK